VAEGEAPYSVAGLWSESWASQAFKRWALKLRRQLLPKEVSLGLVFISPSMADYAEEIVDVLRNALGIPSLGGCVASGAIVNDSESERYDGVALAIYSLPGARIHEFAFSTPMANEAAAAEANGFWRRRFEPGAEGISSWLAFAEPMSFGIENWLESWQRDFPGIPMYGGLSFFRPPNDVGAVICNDQIIGGGGAVFGFSGGVKLQGLVAQGCVPIGESWTITKAHGNTLERIGNRPAYQILEDTFKNLTEEDRHRSQGLIFVGIAVDEYQADFRSGDFLVRNLLGVDRAKGHLAIGAYPRVGQTMQFQIRDGESASKELREMVDRTHDGLQGKRIFGGILSNCAGRGKHLFNTESHDAQLAMKLLGGQALSGFFGNGEFGPVGKMNFVHGYTSSIALFVDV